MKRFTFLVLVFLLLLPMSALGQDDTIILRAGGDVTTFNPLLWTDGGSAAPGVLIWPPLFDVDRFSGLPVPGLTSWEISEDGLTYTFTIRDDAVWSDGTPITAQDVKFSIESVMSDQVTSPRSANAEKIAAINIIDDKTVAIEFTEVYCTVWQDLVNFYVVPAFRFAPDYSDFMTNPLNTFPDISGGPYILEEWKPDEFTRMRANPTYWKGEPKIPFLINRVIEDPAIVIQALQAGELDYDSLQGDAMEQMASTDNFYVDPFAQNNTGLFFLNWADPDNPQPAYDEAGNPIEQTPHHIFADVRVRQAMAMGYDKDAVLASMGENGATRIVSSVVPSITWAVNSDIEPWNYDPERAAQLLEEAGWIDQDGDGIRECHGCMYDEEGAPLAFEITYSPFFIYFETNALIAQDQLSQLGMDITLTELEWGTYLNEVLVAQRFDVSIVSFGGGSPPDPDIIARAMAYSRNDIPGAGFNVTSYSNPVYDELIEQGATVPGCSIEDRKPIYDEIQRIQHDDVVIDFTISPNFFSVMNKRVQNYNPGPWWTVRTTAHEYTFGG